MKKQYQTVILGATYYGLGYLSTHSDCLLLEESQTVGGDFHHSLYPLEEQPAAGRESALGRILTGYGVWTDTGFDLLKASLAAHELAARLVEEGREILLDARLVNVKQTETGVAVSFLTCEGLCEVWANRLLDTTVDCISSPESVRCTQKTLNVFTVAQTNTFGETLKAACPGCTVREGFAPDEKLVQFPVPVRCGLEEAYSAVCEIWCRAFPDAAEKILFVADDFDAQYVPVSENTVWAGERSANPVAAFLKGAQAE